jgi:DNA-binding MarR family transcriptional regulator
MPSAPKSGGVAERMVSARWTLALVAGGWTPVADYFLDSYTRLDPPLSTSEAMLVIHIMRHKWDHAPPFPGFKTLARRMGVTDTSVRNHARSLEHKGYLVRYKRVGTTNQFDLTPLFRALERLQAVEKVVRLPNPPLQTYPPPSTAVGS